MNNTRDSITSNLDYFTIGLVFLLMIFGWLNIYAAVFDEMHQNIFDLSQRYGKQILWIGISIPIAFIILIIDSKFYSAFAYPIFIIGVLALIGVLFLGIEVNGSKSWFEIGSFRIQPAEFVKFTVALAVAQLLSSEYFSFNKLAHIFRLGLIIGLPIILVLLQNDTGTTLVFFAFIFVLYREGLNSTIFFLAFVLIIVFVLALLFDTSALIFVLSLIIITHYYYSKRKTKNAKIIFFSSLVLISAGIILTYFFSVTSYPSIISLSTVFLILLIMLIRYILSFSKVVFRYLIVFGGICFYIFFVDYFFEHVLKEHQQNRINQILGKYDDPLGVGYNLNQSKIAIGSGGVSGKGFLQGTQTKFNFVPEQSTDFIFCTIGEEWGLLGSLFIISLFAILIIRIIFLSERQRSKFSRIYGYGVASILFFHVAINIAMTVGLAPIIGIPLPFFSYGGSSLWAFTILIFIFIKLDADRLQIFR